VATDKKKKIKKNFVFKNKYFHIVSTLNIKKKKNNKKNSI